MGFFSRNDSSSSTRRGAGGSSDAQIAEMRGRARRRLIGAVVLVLAVIVIVPLLIDNGGDPEPEPTLAMGEAPLVRPGAITPSTGSSNLQVEELVQPPVLVQPDLSVEPEPEPVLEPAQVHAPEPVTPAPVTTEPKPAPKPEPKPEPKPVVEKKPEPSRPANGRTDDGSAALAMLEGRIPPSGAAATKTPAAPQRGNFILQAAAYSTEKDAQGRRQQLLSSGVTNAYVETANSGGRATYRLRVGPFSSREAAVAAQTRLRSLGYQDSFISSQ